MSDPIDHDTTGRRQRIYEEAYRARKADSEGGTDLTPAEFRAIAKTAENQAGFFDEAGHTYVADAIRVFDTDFRPDSAEAEIAEAFSSSLWLSLDTVQAIRELDEKQPESSKDGIYNTLAEARRADSEGRVKITASELRRAIRLTQDDALTPFIIDDREQAWLADALGSWGGDTDDSGRHLYGELLLANLVVHTDDVAFAKANLPSDPEWVAKMFGRV
jgi:hypothetical protein